MIDWASVAEILFSVFLLVLGPILLYYIRSLYNNQKTNYIAMWARRLVFAAEQIYDNNPEKFKRVMSELKMRFPWMDDEDLRIFIESAVRELKNLKPVELQGITGVIDAVEEMPKRE